MCTQSSELGSDTNPLILKNKTKQNKKKTNVNVNAIPFFHKIAISTDFKF